MTVSEKKAFIEMQRNLDYITDFNELAKSKKVASPSEIIDLFYKNQFKYKIILKDYYQNILDLVKTFKSNKISHDIMPAPTQGILINGEPKLFPKIIMNDTEDTDWADRKNIIDFIEISLDDFDRFYDCWLLTTILVIGGGDIKVDADQVNKTGSAPNREGMSLYLLFKVKLYNRLLNASLSEDKINSDILKSDCGSGAKIERFYPGLKIKENPDISLTGPYLDIDPDYKKILTLDEVIQFRFKIKKELKEQDVNLNAIIKNIMKYHKKKPILEAIQKALLEM